MRTSPRFYRLWSLPLLIALLTAGGLVVALLGDEIWDAVSWLMFAAPLTSVAWILSRPRLRLPETGLRARDRGVAKGSELIKS
jgi:hypothetical protein